jgi:hypothetical protein
VAGVDDPEEQDGHRVVVAKSPQNNTILKTGETPEKRGPHVESFVVGFSTAFVASILSGFSGIYFEKVLKEQTEISIWLRTVQLKLMSLVFSVIIVVVGFDFFQFIFNNRN